MRRTEFAFIESVAGAHGPLALKAARNLGLSPIFLTTDPAYYEVWGVESPLADAERIVCADTSSSEDIVRRLDPKRTCGVIALADFHLVTACSVATSMGLPTPSPRGIRAARFKDITRTVLSQAGELMPRFWSGTVEDAPHVSPVGYPCVLKPSDGTGSVGVKILRQGDDVKAEMLRQQSRHKSIRGYALSTRWLVEEYIPGPEFSAELIYVGGCWTLIGITKKLLSSPPRAVEVGHIFPADICEATRIRIKRKIVSWLDAIGLDFGAAHVEFKMVESEPVLMEINPRIGGDMIPELVRLSTELDILTCILELHSGLGLQIRPEELVPRMAAAIGFFTSDRAGVVQEVQGQECLSSNPDVVQWQIRSAPFVTQGAESNYDRIGFVIVIGPTPSMAESRLKDAMSSIALRYDRDRNIGHRHAEAASTIGC